MVVATFPSLLPLPFKLCSLRHSHNFCILMNHACAGSVVLTQTHPAAPYVCRTGNITLRCQYDGVENVLAVLWAIGNETSTANPSTIPGHTALPRTTTYQDLVVDSYTNLRERYQCGPFLRNGIVLESNRQETQIESKPYISTSSMKLCMHFVLYQPEHISSGVIMI